MINTEPMVPLRDLINQIKEGRETFPEDWVYASDLLNWLKQFKGDLDTKNQEPDPDLFCIKHAAPLVSHVGRTNRGTIIYCTECMKEE